MAIKPSAASNPVFFWVVASFVFRQMLLSQITALLLSKGKFIIDSFSQLLEIKCKIPIIIENQSSSQVYFNQVKNFSISWQCFNTIFSFFHLYQPVAKMFLTSLVIQCLH